MEDRFGGTVIKDPPTPEVDRFGGIVEGDKLTATAEDLYREKDNIIDLSEFDESTKAIIESEKKRKIMAKYYSRQSGLAEKDIYNNYEATTPAHGGSGNHEADFEHFVGKLGINNTEGGLDELKQLDGNVKNSIIRSYIFDGIGSLAETFYREVKETIGFVATFEDHARGRQVLLNSEIKRLDKRIADQKKNEGPVSADDPLIHRLREKTIERDSIEDYFKAKKENVVWFRKFREWESIVSAQREFAKEVEFPVDDEFAQSFKGQLIAGAGGMAFSLSAFVGGSGFGLLSNSAQIYQGGFDDARAHGATEAEARDAGVKMLPAATLDAFIDKFLVTRFLKPLKGKMTVGQLSRLIAASTVAGGMSEGAEQLWGNINAQYLSKYDENRELDEGVLSAIAIGSILSFGVQSVPSTVNYTLQKRGKVDNPSPLQDEMAVLREHYTDEELLNQGGDMLLAAANGDPDALKFIQDAVAGKLEGKKPGELIPRPVELSKEAQRLSDEDVPQDPDDLLARREPEEAARGTFPETTIQPLPKGLNTPESLNKVAEEQIIETIDRRSPAPIIPSVNSLAAGFEAAGVKTDAAFQKFVSLSTRIGNISKAVKLRTEKMDQEEVILSNQGTIETDPFIDSVNKRLKTASDAEHDVIVAEILNGEFNKLKARGISHTERLRDFLDDRGARIPNISLIENYYPRRVKDLDELYYHFSKQKEGIFEKAIREATEKKGSPLTKRERISVVGRVLKQPNQKGMGFLKRRTIEHVTPDMVQFYADPLETLRLYNHRTAELISKREFLGEGVFDVGDIELEATSINETAIQEYLEEVAPDLTPLEESEIIRLLKSRLQFSRGGDFFDRVTRWYRTAVALKYVTGLKTLMVQTSDMGMMVLENGLLPTNIINTVTGVAKRQKFVNEFGKEVQLTLDMAGIDSIDQELRDALKTKAGLAQFALAPLRAVDRRMKQGLMNSISNRWQKESVSNPTALKKELMEIFGEEGFVSGIMSDLKNKKVSDNLLFAFYVKISEYHPTGISQHTKFYIDHPKARAMFVLKSFAFKRLDLIYRRAVKDMTLGLSEAAAGASDGDMSRMKAGATQFGQGTSELFKMLALLYGTETIVEMLYYQITPDEEDDDHKFLDLYIENVVNIFPFLNVYDLKRGVERGDMWDAFMESGEPPEPILWGPVSELIESLATDEPYDWDELKEDIPLIGKFLPESSDSRTSRSKRSKSRNQRGD